MRYKNSFEYLVRGMLALFSDPLTRVGGEKFSYPVPSYEALKGITESIYWKPTFNILIDSVRVMKPISMQAKGVRPIFYGSAANDLAIYTYLTNVEYRVRAHFEWCESRPELKDDRNENKHYFIMKRMIEKGGRRDVYLGTRECQAYVEPAEFDCGEGAYDNTEEIAFGTMFHSFAYPEESGAMAETPVKGRKTAKGAPPSGSFGIRLWQPVMRRGIIDFCRPEECTIRRELSPREIKTFKEGVNFTSCDELYREEGGIE